MTVWKIVVKKRKENSRAGSGSFPVRSFVYQRVPKLLCSPYKYYGFFHSKLEIQCMFYWTYSTLKICLVNRVILGNFNFTSRRMKLEVNYHFSFWSENYLILIFSPSFPLGINPQIWRLLQFRRRLELINCLRLCVPSGTAVLHVECTKYVTSRHTYYWRLWFFLIYVPFGAVTSLI